jgi:phosphopantothenoylcysteine decarboxylase/phosphopantothenate--cysteine ligase
MQEVAGKKILLGVSGGIAAYKVVQLARDLAEAGADVRVLMTPSAERFVGSQTFAALTGNAVASKLFGSGGQVPHVELARGAALMIVAPATANVIAKMAGGFADDLLSAALLTASCPVLVVPAMHTEMWEHPATQRNVSTLASNGVHLLGPAVGALSSGDSGTGRMVEPDEIMAETRRLLGTSSELEGRRVLVTAGGTREALDPVRYIGNRSSGRMGYLVAEAAIRRGAKVTLVSGPSQMRAPRGVDLVSVTSAAEMAEAVFAAAGDSDVIVKAAAVADFTPVEPAATKIKKSSGVPRIELAPTTDILARLGGSAELRKPGSVLVGFAAETARDSSELAHLADEKRTRKGADIIVANQVGVEDSGFDVATSRVTISTLQGTEDLGLVTKEDLADLILDRVGAALAQ